MRVLQVASASQELRGVERHILNLRQGLLDLGHEVVVTCPAQAAFASRIDATVPITLRRSRDFRALSAYLKLFRGPRFDAVHVHHSRDSLMPVVAARARRQGILVLSRYVTSHWSKRRSLLTSRLFDRICPISEAVARSLIASGVSESKLEVVLPGVERPSYSGSLEEARATLGIEDSSLLHLGTFSRLVPEKGLGLLIDAVSDLEGVRVHLYSDGPQAKELRERASRLSNVQLHGFVEDLSVAIQAMDAVVIPTTWEDASPKKALQALAHGKPVLAARIGGHPDVVQDEVNGYLFEPNSVESLRSTIEVSLSARDTLVQMGEAGKAGFESRFTLGHMAERMVSVYQSQAQRAS